MDLDSYTIIALTSVQIRAILSLSLSVLLLWWPNWWEVLKTLVGFQIVCQTDFVRQYFRLYNSLDNSSLGI